MGRTRREGAKKRSLGLAATGAAVLAVAGVLLWPVSSGHAGEAYAQSSTGGVIPIPSAAADAAASYWSARLGSASAGSSAPSDSGTAGAAIAALTPGLPSAGAGLAAAGAAQQAAEDAGGAPMAVSNPLASSPFTGVPQVGALFSASDGSVQGQGHFCSGSVVNSPQGDVVLTAAHCVYDTNGAYTDLAFVPGYHDGQDPYGVWTPSDVVVPPQWAADEDPDYDVAFLVVHEAGSSARIQDVVGGDQLGLEPAYAGLTQVVGYPQTTEKPITCTNLTTQVTDPSLTVPQLQFDCVDYPGGTSGGPFLRAVDANTGLGTVVGVIGGFEAGGDTPDVSYASYFGPWVGSLFAQAESKG
jgi:V8-like Glu-specific endopeptidase